MFTRNRLGEMKQHDKTFTRNRLGEERIYTHTHHIHRLILGIEPR